jgi:hypothetical protein
MTAKYALSTLLAVLLGATVTLACAQAQTEAKAASAATAAATSDPRANFRQLELAKLVPASRTDGMRAIFEPRPVRFRARLAQLPQPQKAEYLKKVMGMMGVEAELNVEQRVVLEYGGDKPLAAYVEKGVATRIGQELKEGDERMFYAFHVYNNRYGPALVITSFED